MQLKSEQRGPYQLLWVSGKLDIVTSRQLEERLKQVLEAPGPGLIIDLGGVDYVSSAGLRVLLHFAKELEKAGRVLRLCALQPAVEEIFEVAGFLTIFEVFPSADEASKGGEEF